MQFLKNGPAKSLDFNCSDLQRMSILGGYKSLSCTFFSILPSVRRTVWSSHGMISYQQLTGFNQPVDTINQERDHTEQARLSKDIDTEYYSENEIVSHFICHHNSDSSEPTCKHIGCQ